MNRAKVIKAATVLGLIVCTLVASIILYKTGENKRTIYNHRDEYHQIIYNLFDKEIIENYTAEEFLKKFPPTKVTAHDNYLTLQYFKNDEQPEDCCVFYSYYIHIIAKDNKLVKAFAAEGFISTIDHVFFDGLDDSSEDEYWESRMNNAVSTSSS